eukprot:m.441157 g.441157  ORF g.441157 m.441157 type:complete len:341 (+) comp18622_c0_seq1:2983-4005(+)
MAVLDSSHTWLRILLQVLPAISAEFFVRLSSRATPTAEFSDRRGGGCWCRSRSTILLWRSPILLRRSLLRGSWWRALLCWWCPVLLRRWGAVLWGSVLLRRWGAVLLRWSASLAVWCRLRRVGGTTRWGATDRPRFRGGVKLVGVRHISTTTVVIGVLIRLDLSKGRFQASTAFVTKLVVLVDCGCAPGASRAREGGHNHGTSEVILCLVLGDEVLDRRKIDVLVFCGGFSPNVEPSKLLVDQEVDHFFLSLNGQCNEAIYTGRFADKEVAGSGSFAQEPFLGRLAAHRAVVPPCLLKFVRRNHDHRVATEANSSVFVFRVPSRGTIIASDTSTHSTVML